MIALRNLPGISALEDKLLLEDLVPTKQINWPLQQVMDDIAVDLFGCDRATGRELLEAYFDSLEESDGVETDDDVGDAEADADTLQAEHDEVDIDRDAQLVMAWRNYGWDATNAAGTLLRSAAQLAACMLSAHYGVTPRKTEELEALGWSAALQVPTTPRKTQAESAMNTKFLELGRRVRPRLTPVTIRSGKKGRIIRKPPS